MCFNKTQLSLDTATCFNKSVTDAFITSVNGFGYKPIQSTATASNVITKNSRALMSVNSLTCLFVIGPKYTRLYIHKVYAAPNIKAVAAANPSKKLALTAPKITIHSPTNPAVPGKPQLAIENSNTNADI